MSKNIVETTREAGSFTTLLAALDGAGPADTLAGGGPFTVFAPRRSRSGSRVIGASADGVASTASSTSSTRC